MDQPVEKKNPLLERIRIPGETFRLPSLGLFYTNGELDESAVNGELHIFPMTTLDEIIFKTPDKLFTGDAIVEVFGRCLPQIKQPMMLLAKDVDFLLTALRLVSYGPILEASYMHSCPDAKTHTYSTELRPLLQKAKAIDPTTITSTFTHTLENGQVVSMRPARFDSVVKMSQTMDYESESFTPERIRDTMLDVLSSMIVEVDGITDSSMILEWLRDLRAGWVGDLSTVAAGLGSFGVSTVIDTTCRDCKAPIKFEVSTNPLSFFT